MNLTELKDTFSPEANTNFTRQQIRKSLKLNLQRKFKNKSKTEIIACVDELMTINGLSEDKFNCLDFVQKMIDSNINDLSIDDNSNKTEKTIAGIYAESNAANKKIVGYDFLYRVMKGMYGKIRAKRLVGEMIDHSLGLSDSSNILIPYCYALDATKLITEGRPFGTLHSKPAKRVDSYISALNETIHQMSSHLAGAIAIGTFFFDISHLLIRTGVSLDEIKTNEKTRKRLQNDMQKFIHSVNHLSRNSNESPFTNVNIFDRFKLKYIVENELKWLFPDPSGIERPDYNDMVVDFILETQDIFLDLFDAGDPCKAGLPYRFPVCTMNISKSYVKLDEKWNPILDKDGEEIPCDPYIVDTEFLKKFVNERDVLRYNIFASDGTKVCSCCFDENQKVLVEGSGYGPKLITIREANELTNVECPNKRIYQNGIWSEFKRAVVRHNQEYIKVTTVNNKEVVMTGDHLLPCLDGTKPADKINCDDYIRFSTAVYEGKYDNGYGLGVLVGAYAGDGSQGIKDDGGNPKQLVLSLNSDKVEKLKPYLVAFDISAAQNNTIRATTKDKKIIDFIMNRVIGKKSYNKSFALDNIINDSFMFRRGVIDGFYMTDGGNTNRIYTTSDDLRDGLEAIFATCGMQTIINTSDRTDEKVVIRGEEYNRNYPLHCIRWYSTSNKTSVKDIYKKRGNDIFFKVKSVEYVSGSENAYCVQIKGDREPFFTLANGIDTHNCRMVNDSDMLEVAESVNAFGAGALSSLGSHRVCTINYHRLVLESDNINDFWKNYKYRIEASKDILVAHKKLIMLLADAGLQSFVSNYWINMKRMFSTFGVLGIYEMQKTAEKKYGKENIGEDFTGEVLSFLENKVHTFTKTIDDHRFNIEQIPAESYAVRLCNADKVLFGDENVPYNLYANQFVPLHADATIWEKLDADGKYNKLLSGGGIVHATVGERPTSAQILEIIYYAVDVGCEHFAINGIYGVCENGHHYLGDTDVCPECGGMTVEKLTRVVGFFTPVSGWNKTRRELDFPFRTKVDFNDRPVIE